MGGPLSLLAWNFSFDPILWVSQLATCSEALGYLDGLLSNSFGPGHLLLNYLALLAMTHGVGLCVEDHTCTQIWCSQGYEAVRSFLLAFRAD